VLEESEVVAVVGVEAVDGNEHVGTMAGAVAAVEVSNTDTRILGAMNRRALRIAVLTVLGSGPCLPAQRARDSKKAKAAEEANQVAWFRVALALDGLYVLLRLRDELRDDISSLFGQFKELDADSRLEIFEKIDLRNTQLREVMSAFVSQGKVLLDLLSRAVAATLSNPGGFQQKHGGLGIRLSEYAAALGVTAPPHELAGLALRLDEELADVRDDVLTHPKGRVWVNPKGPELEVYEWFPPEEGLPDPSALIAIDKLAADIEAYVGSLTDWLVVALNDSK